MVHCVAFWRRDGIETCFEPINGLVSFGYENNMWMFTPLFVIEPTTFVFYYAFLPFKNQQKNSFCLFFGCQSLERNPRKKNDTCILPYLAINFLTVKFDFQATQYMS